MAGLTSLQGHNMRIARLLQQVADTGSLHVYLVVVNHHEYCEAFGNGLGDYAFEEVSDSETSIGHWMRLDGSNPGFADILMGYVGEHIMQVSTYRMYRHCITIGDVTLQQSLYVWMHMTACHEEKEEIG